MIETCKVNLGMKTLTSSNLVIVGLHTRARLIDAVRARVSDNDINTIGFRMNAAQARHSHSTGILTACRQTEVC
jgi:hypothetical protein